MTVRVAIVVFPGSNCEHDVAEALGSLGAEPELVWHSAESLGGFDAVVLPGGFAHGDYLRPGAIARFSPVMSAVAAFAASGGPVVGICNGFQILTEAGLLPGAFRPNAELRFICHPVVLEVVSTRSVLTGEAREGQLLEIPVNHHDGNYACSELELARLEERGQVVLRYTQNPNGSMHAIAGVCNPGGNVVGLMPHPERATDPLLGSTDGRVLLGSLIAATAQLAASPPSVAVSDDTQAAVPSGTAVR